MIFSIFITAVNLMNVFLTPKRNSLPINSHFPFPPNPSNPWQPQSTFCLSKLNLFETFHRIIQNTVFCDWILSHSIMFSGFIHVEACVSSSFLYNELYSFIISFILNNIHSTEVPPFVYPLICRWIFALLMLFGYCIWIMSLWIFIYLFLCGHTFSFLLNIYLRVKLLCRLIICEESSGSSPKGLHHFAFPPAAYEGSSFCTSLPTFVFHLSFSS